MDSPAGACEECLSGGCWISISSHALLATLGGAMLKAFLTYFNLSSERPDHPGRFAMHRHPLRWNFFFYTTASFPHREVHSELGPKISRCTATIDCVLAPSSTQKASYTHVAAICTQRASLAANYETKRPLRVQ